MDYENIIFDLEGSVATITLNQPRILNAMNEAMIDVILDALEQASMDDSIRALVITGAGRGFCSGDNVKEPITHKEIRAKGPDSGNGSSSPPFDSPANLGDVFRYKTHLMLKAIRNLRKPVIAAVNGNAHGVGSDLALACDFRVASEDAILGDLRTSAARPIATGACYFIPRLVGLAKAVELLFTGKLIDATEAERIGLVNKTVPVEKFKEEVAALANELAQGPTKIIGRVKEQIYRQVEMDLSGALEDGWRETRDILEHKTADGTEGSLAFLEKRPPKYTGK